ncbi:MAG: HAD-IB family phosphatase [Puniceicoccales bacterium]|nr:HAD-IB family phosphatase [Puniceicoccales bacterium]
MSRLLFFDCDSTLSAIEGIDEFARLRGPTVFAEVEQMTRNAMDGGLPLEEVFARRLDLIRPREVEVAAIAQLYLDRIEADATDALAALRGLGWTPVIISGGLRQAILPLAARLQIERVEAVDLFFNADGTYRSFQRDFPTARAGGKCEVIAALKKELRPAKTVMVGDGASDLETQPCVDLFVGFGGFVERPRVKAEAAAFITRLNQLIPLLAD